MADATINRYVLLPRTGTRARQGPALQMLVALPTARSTEEPLTASVRVPGMAPITIIDTVAEDGPKLVELDTETAASVNSEDSPLRAVPVVTYSRPDEPLRPLGGPSVVAAAAASTFKVSCTDASSGAGITGVHVVAFSNFAQRAGDEGDTDANGQVQLQIAGATIDLTGPRSLVHLL